MASNKSVGSVLKSVIRNPKAKIGERVKALHTLARHGVSRSFLESILKDKKAPEKLTAAASYIFLELFPESLDEPVPDPLEPSLTSGLSSGSTKKKLSDVPGVPTGPTEQPETTGPKVIDAEVWDLVGGVPGCVRGPDKTEPEQPTPEPDKSNAHRWRRILGTVH